MGFDLYYLKNYNFIKKCENLEEIISNFFQIPDYALDELARENPSDKEMDGP